MQTARENTRLQNHKSNIQLCDLCRELSLCFLASVCRGAADGVALGASLLPVMSTSDRVRAALDKLAEDVAREAVATKDARDRAPEPVAGWFGDVETMKKTLPGAVIKDLDGSTLWRVPYHSSVQSTAAGPKIKVLPWVDGTPQLKDQAWVKEHLGDALKAVLPGKMPGESNPRPGLRGTIGGVAFTAECAVPGNLVRLVPVEATVDPVEASLDELAEAAGAQWLPRDDGSRRRAPHARSWRQWRLRTRGGPSTCRACRRCRPGARRRSCKQCCHSTVKCPAWAMWHHSRLALLARSTLATRWWRVECHASVLRNAYRSCCPAASPSVGTCRCNPPTANSQ